MGQFMNWLKGCGFCFHLLSETDIVDILCEEKNGET